MANNYLQFSSMFPLVRPEKAEEAVSLFIQTITSLVDLPLDQASTTAASLREKLDPAQIGPETPREFAQLIWAENEKDPDFELEILPMYEFTTTDASTKQPSLWLGSDDYGDLNVTGLIMRVALATQEPKTEWVLPYSFSCSRPRVDEFGGGVLVVSVGRAVVWEADSLRRSTQQGWYGIDIYNSRYQTLTVARQIISPANYDGCKLLYAQINENTSHDLDSVFTFNDETREFTIVYTRQIPIAVLGEAMAKLYPFVRHMGDWYLQIFSIPSTYSIDTPEATMLVIRNGQWGVVDIDSAFTFVAEFEKKFDRPTISTLLQDANI